MGSFVSVVGFEDYALSQKFSEDGLIANPDDPILINNLAFSLANQGLIDEARKKLGSIPRPTRRKEFEVMLLATEGLILFKEGKVQEGKAYYEKSIKEAENNSLGRLKLLAKIFLVREELRAGLLNGDSLALLESEIQGWDNYPEFAELLSQIKVEHKKRRA